MDKKIIEFIKEHHVLTLATSANNQPYCSNCFYAFLEEEQALVFTSDTTTRHIEEAQNNEKIAASIVLETKTIGKIQGIQITGELIKPEGDLKKKIQKKYLKRFPYAVLMKTTLWFLRIDFLKMTDNRLGFGKKLIWERKEECIINNE